ncbi:mechanosensitive ion channel family protein [Synechococcus sp. UW179A]|uniref:mechanosensitive ion channel family protein n=1 Tax=Synechococcus sp. UW179A TaxID=2575510 RepID=UPI000E0EF28F|nr:mechanosensitive ion channel family protein [Synechococcus sp. UW179A]
MIIPSYLSLAVLRWLGGFFAVLALRYFFGFLIRRIRRKKHNFSEFIRQLLIGALVPAGLLLTLVWGWDALPDAGQVDEISYAIVSFIAMVLLVRLSNTSLVFFVDSYIRQKQKASFSPEMFAALSPILRVFVWVIALLIYFRQQGLQLGAIFAALAGAGIGVGIAFQRPIQNWADYIIVLFDKPFSFNQLIRVGKVVGRVEQVGVRTTSIRSVSGQLIVMSNSDLLDSTIEHLDDFPRRRIKQIIGVEYGTSPELLELVPGLIETAVNSVSGAEFDRANFISFGDFALKIEYVFYVASSKNSVALGLRHSINIQILRCFGKHNIRFAVLSCPDCVRRLKSEARNGD